MGSDGIGYIPLKDDSDLSLKQICEAASKYPNALERK